MYHERATVGGAVLVEAEKKIAEEKMQLQEAPQGEMCLKSGAKELVEVGKTELRKVSWEGTCSEV